MITNLAALTLVFWNTNIVETATADPDHKFVEMTVNRTVVNGGNTNVATVYREQRHYQKQWVETPAPGKPPPNPMQQTITGQSRFKAFCPYCGTETKSDAPFVSGGVSTTNGVMQQWTIPFKCRNCKMQFTDSREQGNPVVRSVQIQ